MSKLTQERLRELLDYDPETGLVKWRQSRGRVKAGDIAGCHVGSGYIDIRVDGEQHRLHRVIFMMVHGRWPDLVDHVNGVRSDNKLSNLREATQVDNLRNARRWDHNRSGIAGVFWNAGKQKWTAKIKVRGRSIHLGHFDDKAAAASARKDAEKQYGFSPTHGRDPVGSAASNQHRKTRSEHKGIWRNGPGWCVVLYAKRQRRYVGQFRTIEEAVKARDAAAAEQGIVLTDPGELLHGARKVAA